LAVSVLSVDEIYKRRHTKPRRIERAPMSTDVAEAAAVAAEAPEARGVPFLDLPANGCKWPLGAMRDPVELFCAAPRRAGKPYCAHHCAIAYPAPVKAHSGAARPLLTLKKR
jgi:hypothetical protein